MGKRPTGRQHSRKAHRVISVYNDRPTPVPPKAAKRGVSLKSITEKCKYCEREVLWEEGIKVMGGVAHWFCHEDRMAKVKEAMAEADKIANEEHDQQ